MKESSNIILAVGLIIITCLLTDYIFIKFLFKRYHSEIPNIWRQKTYRSYIAVILSSILFACLFLLFHIIFKNNLGDSQFYFTIIFGILIWLGFYFPSFQPSNTPVLKINRKAAISLMVVGVTKVIGASLIVLLIF